MGWYRSSRVLYIAMEHLPLGELGAYLHDHEPIPEDDAGHIISQVLDGLVIMHRENSPTAASNPQIF